MCRRLGPPNCVGPNTSTFEVQNDSTNHGALTTEPTRVHIRMVRVIINVAGVRHRRGGGGVVAGTDDMGSCWLVWTGRLGLAASPGNFPSRLEQL